MNIADGICMQDVDVQVEYDKLPYRELSIFTFMLYCYIVTKIEIRIIYLLAVSNLKL